ncbi:1-aminocyclopropane-1-carboxylate deaminase/D-cysteine desulfhydrase [Permianibacter aggregans]|uniref:1-aminocyclopropane-1-carboxylate deaminase/D-cysteine desulfhydrase-like pyridoxal-dependent ACC family enzyme n=1 Tax=Permianibacter aggregans TaxID=1510150 RepID=A0A4R6UMW9_9GAMM|nr:pyridoxal-phosphate dependent enzyme [Permianibacter aggregans]QGX40908.1 pyridoxal-phosphate dependent enzyme [Permianibacter aggregans]TDQ48271.1 1-aminocyclopropane-1-carboxylate deaminase/D-cysteine desulfhydrase-like pyridoxal-dependent ACC family enzyme [Permianibacter aggregans]
MSSLKNWFDALAPAPLQQLEHTQAKRAGVELFVLREDCRGQQLSGNKARKLKYLLLEAERRGVRRVISVGGAHSNHLHALAAAGAQCGFVTEAFVRLAEDAPLTPTLIDCQQWGMRLHRLDREQFRALRDEPQRFFSADPETLFIPEGGSTPLALAGVAEMLDDHPQRWSIVLTAAGTGATAAGLACSPFAGEVWAVPVLKQGGYLRAQAKQLLTASRLTRQAPIRWLLNEHHGGYGKVPDELLTFCADFSAQHHIPLEPIYTGKVCYAFERLLSAGAFRRGQRVLLVHNGGLQGWRQPLAISAPNT